VEDETANDASIAASSAELERVLGPLVDAGVTCCTVDPTALLPGFPARIAAEPGRLDQEGDRQPVIAVGRWDWRPSSNRASPAAFIPAAPVDRLLDQFDAGSSTSSPFGRALLADRIGSTTCATASSASRCFDAATALSVCTDSEREHTG